MAQDGRTPDLRRLLAVAQRLRAGVGIRDRWYHLTVYECVFVGSEAVDFLVSSGFAASRPEAVLLGNDLMDAKFFHHVVDEHHFHDRELFYRFYIDEDKKYKELWRAGGDGGGDGATWRMQPHTSCNSLLLPLRLTDALHHAWLHNNREAFTTTLRAMRETAVQYTLQTDGWRVSKSRTDEDVTVYVQSDPYASVVRCVKAVTLLPHVPVHTVLHTLSSLAQRSKWDATHHGTDTPAKIIQRLDGMLLPEHHRGDVIAVTAPPASALTLADTGAGSDSDEELLHERMARVISRSSLLRHVFKGVAKRTEASQQYLHPAELSSLPEPTQEDAPLPTGFPRIVYRQVRPVTSLSSVRDVCVLQDCALLPHVNHGTGVMYEISVQHRLIPPSSSCVRGEVLGLCYVVEPVDASEHGTQSHTGDGEADTHTPSATTATSPAAAEPSAGCRITVFAHVAYKGRIPTYAEDRILTKNSLSLLSRLRRVLLPSSTGGETSSFDGIPMDGDAHTTTTTAPAVATAGATTTVPGDAHAHPVTTKVGLGDFEILAVIGRGGYGKVFQVRHRVSGDIYAMKTLKKKDIIARKQVGLIVQPCMSAPASASVCVLMQASRTMVERNILSAIDHPYIVSLKFAFQTSRKLFMVMDFVSGGDFFSLLTREGRLPERRVRLYMAELVCALEHLHGLGIVYRDLKPENVLLDCDGHVKLTDFGLSRFIVRRQPSSALLADDPHPSPVTPASSITSDSPHPPSPVTPAATASAHLISHSFCGTEQYMAPEVLLQKGHSAAVDLWSLGILFSEMLTGKHPFRGLSHHATLKNIVSPVVPPATVVLMSPAAGELLCGLLQKNPRARLGTDDTGGYAALKAHAFFAGMDWSAVAVRGVKPEFVPHIARTDDVSNFDQVFTREAPVLSDATVAAPKGSSSGGMFSGWFGRKPSTAAAATAAPTPITRTTSRISSTDDAQFRKFSFVSPEML